MPIIQLIVLAIVQGITEFLPISSSAHLILAPLFVEEWADQGPLIDVAAHVGTLFAVMAYFNRETTMLISGAVDTVTFRSSANKTLFLFIFCASLPVIFLGAVLAITGLIDYLRSPYVIAGASIFFGLLLWHADRGHADRAPSDEELVDGLTGITWRQAMVIGLAQTLSLIPGASRSGVTMTAARYLGWSRPDAARFSMLLAMPTIAAIGMFAGVKMISQGTPLALEAAAIVAALSCLVAFVVIAAFMKFTQSVSFTPFVIYRVVMGMGLFAIAGQLN
ncbi:MAG: undecaprenyl-diphosphate phosphatase [Pseudomonadota bacterium]